MTKIYFKVDSKYHVLDDDKKYVVLDDLPKDGSMFYVFKGYDASEEGLRKFKTDMFYWKRELKKLGKYGNGILHIDYAQFHGHQNAALATFKRLSPKALSSCAPISVIEGEYFENCYNGGLTYCNPGIHQSYGYDYSSYYAYLLASPDFKIPIKEGYETTLTKLPISKNLKVGIYHVRIESSNKDFQKIFAFSKDQMYTNYSLAFALQHKKKYDITIELNDGINAYLYNDEDVKTGAEIFGKWYETLMKIKNKYPKNKLLKNLLSALWGGLSQGNYFYRTQQQVKDEGLEIGHVMKNKPRPIIEIENSEYKDDGSVLYKLLDPKHRYKYNMRLKPFLTSFGRVKIADIARKHIDSVVRIHTDGIAFNKPLDYEIEGFIEEDKTTGVIDWKHINHYLIKFYDIKNDCDVWVASSDYSKYMKDENFIKCEN
jgi:hypothetical protein